MQLTGGFRLWKLVGDEVLLYHKIVSEGELYHTILFIDKIRKEIVKGAIKKYVERNQKIEAKKHEDEKILLKYFDVKTTLWIGSCATSVETISSKYPNLIYDSLISNLEVNASYHQNDFLGPDIDEGFRLCEYAEKGQMIISPKIIALLLKMFEDGRMHSDSSSLFNNQDIRTILESNFRIVNYVQMKGIWEGRIYPIVMFCQRDTRENNYLEQWKRMFEYDAFKTSVLYQSIEKYGEEFLINDKFSVYNLLNIYRNIGQMDDIEQMANEFKNQIERIKNEPPSVLQPKQPFEFHIACLCYDKGKKEIWITDHPTHGWSFGCVRVTNNVDYFRDVKYGYKAKYGLDIEIDEKSPILSFYSANRLNRAQETGKEETGKKNGSILGTVLLTDVDREKSLLQNKTTERDANAEKSNKTDKDKEISKWVSLDEALGIANDETKKKITNFKIVLEKAREYIDNPRQGGHSER